MSILLVFVRDGQKLQVYRKLKSGVELYNIISRYILLGYILIDVLHLTEHRYERGCIYEH